MDAALPIEGLIQEFSALVEAEDFEGAEELMAQALGSQPNYEPFLHYQLGRMYIQWNKMSSAVNHLGKAAELAQARADALFLLQVVEELRLARKRQAEQCP